MSLWRWKMITGVGLTALISFGAVGCAEPGPSTGPAAQTGVEQGALEMGPTKDEVPTPVVDEVDWKEALEGAAIAMSRLTEAQQEVVGRAKLPVMLPDDDAYLAAAILTAGERWYAASMPLEGRTVVVQGTRQAFDVPGLSNQPKEPMVNPHAHELTRTKGIVSLAFKAYGVAYMVDVECAAPMTDTRCTEDKYILDVAERLAVVAGGDHE